MVFAKYLWWWLGDGLWHCCTHISYGKWPMEIVDLPIKNGDLNHSYVSHYQKVHPINPMKPLFSHGFPMVFHSKLQQITRGYPFPKTIDPPRRVPAASSPWPKRHSSGCFLERRWDGSNDDDQNGGIEPWRTNRNGNGNAKLKDKKIETMKEIERMWWNLLETWKVYITAIQMVITEVALKQQDLIPTLQAPNKGHMKAHIVFSSNSIASAPVPDLQPYFNVMFVPMIPMALPSWSPSSQTESHLKRQKMWRTKCQIDVRNCQNRMPDTKLEYEYVTCQIECQNKCQWAGITGREVIVFFSQIATIHHHPPPAPAQTSQSLGLDIDIADGHRQVLGFHT